MIRWWSWKISNATMQSWEKIFINLSLEEQKRLCFPIWVKLKYRVMNSYFYFCGGTDCPLSYLGQKLMPPVGSIKSHTRQLKDLNPYFSGFWLVGLIYRPWIETNAYLMVGKPTLRDKPIIRDKISLRLTSIR